MHYYLGVQASPENDFEACLQEFTEEATPIERKMDEEVKWLQAIEDTTNEIINPLAQR